MKNSIKRYQIRFLKKPFISLLVLYIIITVLLLAVGFYYYIFQKDKIVNDRFEYLASTATFRSSQINDWLNEKYSDLQIIKSSAPLVALSKKNISDVQNVSPEIRNWFAVLKKYYGYDNIMLFTRTFKFVYSLDPVHSSLTKSDSSLINAVLDSNMVRFSDSDERTANQKFFKFYVPIKNEYTSASNTGVLVLTLDPKNTFESILDRSIDKSPTIETLLIKAVDDSVAYLNKLRFSNRRTESKYDDSNKALYQTSPVKERRGFVSGRDYKNDEVIAFIQKVPSTAWFLITKINESEFYGPVNNLAKIVFLTITSADLLFAVILFFIWRKNIVANIRRIYRAEMEKSKLENRFNSIVNGVKDIAIFVLDVNGNVISWNEGAQRIKGYSSREIIGKHFSIFYPEEDKVIKPAAELKAAIENGSSQDDGWRIRKDGSAFWANVVITSLTDENGEVYGFLKIAHDQTEKRKNEEEIKNSRDFYLKLLNDFPNPVWRSGLDGKCNYFNKAWLNFTGRLLDEELGEGWALNLHTEDKEEVLKNYYEAFKHRRTFTLEYRLKDFNGDYKWIVDFGMPYYDFENNFAGYIGSCYDITDRKKYEDTVNTLLSISEKLYSSLEIDQISDSLVTESIKLTDAESGFASIKTEDGFVAKRYYNKDHWEYLDKTYLSLNPARLLAEKNGYVLDDKEKIRSMDEELINKYRINEILSMPLFDSSGDLIGFFELHNKKNNKHFNNDDVNLLRGVARNASISITKSSTYEKLRKTEHQLRSSESELRNLAAQIQYAREAERQRIAREVHDELGQLLTGINLNVSLLAELLEQNKKPTVSEILDELHSVQEFVNKGIQSVRDISSSLRSYVLDHLGLIPAVQEYCREIERISNVACNFESELESFNLDDERNVALFRIIQEALTNAIRHADASYIDVKISQSDNNLEINISDDGKGIDNGSESLSNSMGILGMKERAIFLGGKLSIESIHEKGTQISLLLPLGQKQKNLKG